MAESAINNEINFYKPVKRFIIPIKSFHIPKKLFSKYKNTKFTFKINSDFSAVINNCSKITKDRNNTWINNIIKNSYINLNKEGHAYSIECLDNKEIIGGLYGVQIGKIFFGESMFSNQTDVSKFCLLYLISILIYKNFDVLDSQFYNRHLLQFGAYEISNTDYEIRLRKAILESTQFPVLFKFDKSLSILQSLRDKSNIGCSNGVDAGLEEIIQP